MPVRPRTIRALLAEWNRTVTYLSLHTGDPGDFGSNELETVFPDTQKVVQDKQIVWTLSNVNRLVRNRFSTATTITHLAYRYDDGSVFASRSIGIIKLGRSDYFELPSQLTVVTLKQIGS